MQIRWTRFTNPCSGQCNGIKGPYPFCTCLLPLRTRNTCRLLPEDNPHPMASGYGSYGGWAASGELDVIEMANDMTEVRLLFSMLSVLHLLSLLRPIHPIPWQRRGAAFKPATVRPPGRPPCVAPLFSPAGGGQHSLWWPLACKRIQQRAGGCAGRDRGWLACARSGVEP